MASPAGNGALRPRRPLGRTGFLAAPVGVGDVADRKVPVADCVATVRRALDAGCNVVDTAPSYEEGYSEEIVGEAVRGRGRDALFVIDKVDHFDRPVAPQVEESLGRLRLDFADLFVFHGVGSADQWRSLARPGGPMEELLAEVRRGRARFRGISAHDPDALREAIESGLCDVVMFPLGPYVHPRYREEILPLARARNVGTVCFKTFGAGKLLGDLEGYGRAASPRPRDKRSSGGAERHPDSGGYLSPARCVRYTLTLDPDVALLGMSFPNEVDEALCAARDFAPLSADERHGLEREAEGLLRNRTKCWWNDFSGAEKS